MPSKICPICAAVSGAWLLLTALVLSGRLDAEIFLPVIALLMGGAVVGIAYQGEKSFIFARTHPMLWKSIFIGLGMLMAFLALRNLSFPVFILEIIFMAALGYLFFIGPTNKNIADKRTSELEKKLKDCC